MTTKAMTSCELQQSQKDRYGGDEHGNGTSPTTDREATVDSFISVSSAINNPIRCFITVVHVITSTFTTAVLCTGKAISVDLLAGDVSL